MTGARISVPGFKAKYGGERIKRLASFDGALHVRVGVLKGTGAHPGKTKKTKREKSGLPAITSATVRPNIAAIAWWNEFGTRRIPSRPFLRWTMRDHNYYRSQLEKALRAVLLSFGKTDPKRLLKRIGLESVRDIRKMITTGNFKPNATATVKAKSTSAGVKDRPLIDTGLLRRSIQYELVDGG